MMDELTISNKQITPATDTAITVRQNPMQG